MRIPLLGLAFTGLIFMTVTTGFVRWSALPNSPGSYFGKEEALYNKLKAKELPDKATAEKLLWVGCESNHASDACRLLETLRANQKDNAQKSWDEEYSCGFAKLAAIQLCDRRIDNALNTYKQQLEYDRRFLAADDKRIGRDYNNVGMAYFMTGQTSKLEAVRKKNWQLAEEMFAKAASTKMAEEPLSKLAIVQNQLVLAEGRDDLPEIARLQEAATQLRAKLSVPVPVVQF